MVSQTEVQPGRVYLDVCALCRPFDDQSQARIRVETNSVDLILAHVRQGRISLIVSPAHDVEISAIVDREERNQLMALLRRLGMRSEFDVMAGRHRAEELVRQGMGAADAAHLAFAEMSQADFVTVDDRLAKKCMKIRPMVWFGSPLAYCDKEGLR